MVARAYGMIQRGALLAGDPACISLPSLSTDVASSSMAGMVMVYGRVSPRADVGAFLLTRRPSSTEPQSALPGTREAPENRRNGRAANDAQVTIPTINQATASRRIRRRKAVGLVDLEAFPGPKALQASSRPFPSST